MKLYEFVGGVQNGRVLQELDVAALHQIIGNGYSKDWTKERQEGGIVPCEELDNEYRFAGYIGPMYDGIRLLVGGEWKYDFCCTEEEKETSTEAYVLRYESPEVYEQLSR